MLAGLWGLGCGHIWEALFGPSCFLPGPQSLLLHPFHPVTVLYRQSRGVWYRLLSHTGILSCSRSLGFCPFNWIHEYQSGLPAHEDGIGCRHISNNFRLSYFVCPQSLISHHDRLSLSETRRPRTSALGSSSLKSDCIYFKSSDTGLTKAGGFHSERPVNG